ncbi:hypothetical protein DZF91_11690 [Actinomadura logoneensis]|uniref:Uncharacterized protein n=1 Tax=Actinomadura logoneensis TaxID=2293572 RepID=A0A372JN48_9ACTN|nr:hypothetical protein [Actinomadura logoneensis]RFU41435.1 hypothetical protein DZF91_11690 [Actinomadura logoneensis]
MTLYAYDDQQRSLSAIWGTGTGHRLAPVAAVPESTKDRDALRLAEALTTLSGALWRTYTHPPEAAGSLEENSEGWRRAQTQAVLPKVPEILENPNLPDGGTMVVSYDPVEESAHHVGRALHAISDDKLSDAVIREVRTELDAIERAGLGDLTGRAAHAVTLTRAGASPAQIAAADELLRTGPLGDPALFTDLDPAASAVAAAHWLQAAADVTAKASGIAPTAIVRDADNIEALPYRTPTIVLELMQEGLSPYDAVTHLLAEAMAVAEGYVYDVEELQVRFAELDELADRYPDLPASLLAEVRLTTLDPTRPALDLLEDLLTGIRACWLIYSESADLDIPDTEDEAYAEELDEQVHTAFLEAVRKEAQKTADRLH